jgi:predicted secreted hydrolase
VGWDWLSLQLTDNTELMLYRLRHKDGSMDPFSSGTYVDSSGKSTSLSIHDFTMMPLGETYASPVTRAVYPIEWRVNVPSQNLNLQLKTPLASQELASDNSAGLSYWEGAITINGTRAGAAITGVGYLEMTGYAAALKMGTAP